MPVSLGDHLFPCRKAERPGARQARGAGGDFPTACFAIVRAWKLLLCSAIAFVGCSDGAGLQPNVPVSIVAFSGDAQEATAGSVLGQDVAVRVSASDGEPSAGAVVTWSIEVGGGSVASSESVTDAHGLARTGWTLGTAAGVQVLRAGLGAGGDKYVLFFATASPGSAAGLEPVGGLDQEGGHGEVLADSLVVEVVDQHHNPVPGVPIQWSVTAGGGSISPETSETDDQGLARAAWTLGTLAEQQSVEAASGLLVAGFQATAALTDAPVVASVTPDTLSPGDSVTLAGSGFSPQAEQNQVTVAGQAASVLASSGNQLTFIVPAQEVLGCKPTETVSVTVTTSAGTGSILHPLAVARQVDLAPGQFMATLDPDLVACHELLSPGADYMVSVFHTGTVPSAQTDFELTGLVPDSVATQTMFFVPDSSPRTPSSLRPHRRSLSPAGHGASSGLTLFESQSVRAGIHDANRRLAARLQAQSPLAGGAVEDELAALAQGLVRTQAVVPVVGDTVEFRVPDINSAGICDNYVEVQARVVYAGEHAIVYEDVKAPLAEQMDQYFQFLGEDFDTLQYGIVLDYFGDPVALNTSGTERVQMLFSPVVNSFEGLTGFVIAGDFFPREQCQSSDEAEVFYATVPTEAGEGYGFGTVGHWLWYMRSTLVHEAKHLASYSARLARNAWFEDTWLEEATAMIAEELLGRAVFGYDRGGRTDYGASIYCEVRPDREECAGSPLIMYSHFALLHDYYADVEVLTPIGNMVVDPAGTFYGSGWLLARWAADHHADGDAHFFQALNQTSLTGTANLEAVTGRSFPELLADFGLALAVDGLPGFTADRSELGFPSWDTRDIFSGLSQDYPGSFPAAFPLAIRRLDDHAFHAEVSGLRAGSAALFELPASQQSTRLLHLQAAGGGAPPATLRVAIVRIQ